MVRNKDGYMLVEIVLAFVIAFAIVFFIINLVIRVKNKNDDTLVESLVVTDTAIVNNKLMEYAKIKKEDFQCSDIEIAGNVIKYQGQIIDVFTAYATLGELSCSNDAGNINVFIPVTVSQIPGEDYDININYRYKINDYVFPQIILKVADGTTYKKTNKGIVTISDNDGLESGTYTLKYYWGTSGGKICNSFANSKNFTVTSGTKKVEVELPISSGTGKGRLYVCNLQSISDIHGNVLPQAIYDAVMYLDNTGPVFEYKRDGIFTAVVECRDNDVDKAKGVLNTFKEPLSGTSDINISKSCTDSLGNSATGTHVYKYSNCARGENTCKQTCNECQATECAALQCVIYHYPCPPCYSCGKGHNTCEAGFVVD